jgi:hypothetical protein
MPGWRRAALLGGLGRHAVVSRLSAACGVAGRPAHAAVLEHPRRQQYLASRVRRAACRRLLGDALRGLEAIDERAA